MVDPEPWWIEDPILPGEFYEDCAYHPVLCVSADYSVEVDELVGISLVTGSIGACSPRHCGPVRLTTTEAIGRRVDWQRFSTEDIPRRGEVRGSPRP